MALTPGMRLGTYEIKEPIGAGGMGEVYRATDTRLRREVAIKVLPEDVAQDPERLARFEREAQLLASLNHPNIATIYGLERSGETSFLVLELVEGETLAERLSGGALPLADVLEISRQIAEGVDAAHERGVIHRDLKPPNVKITPEGKVKILDFGLAKALADPAAAEDPSQSPTRTQEMTRAGAIMGTTAYMSPEQARGQTVDRRTDVWAFGVVVHEMLTGTSAFARPSMADTLAAVMTLELAWDELPEHTPRALKRLLRRSLHKDPRQRLHDIADARLEIEEAAAESDRVDTVAEMTLAGAGRRPWMRTALWLLPAAAGIGVLAAWIAWIGLAGPAAIPNAVTRLDLNMPPGVSMDADSLRPGITISPDGRWLVFVASEAGTRKLFKRSLDKFDVAPIPGTENARFAFFSPDGRWVGFWDATKDKIKKVALDGGVPVVLCDAPNAWGATWGANGKIVFPRGDLSGLWQVAEAGGEPELLLAPSPENGVADYIMPAFLPDGTAVLYTAWRGGFTAASAQIGILDLASGETRVLLENAASAQYVSTGHLIFGRGGRAEVVPFDPERREITGPAVPLPEPIFFDPGGTLHVALSTSGTLAFVPGERAPQRQLVLTDLHGNSEAVPGTPRGFEYVRFSPDAQRLAATISEFGESSIWIVDRTTGLQTRMAGDGQKNLPVWSPDGSKVAFALETEQPPASWSVYWQRADGSRPPEPLLTAREPGEWLWPSSWTPDGKLLVLGMWSTGSSQDIYYLDVDNPEKIHPLLATDAQEMNGLLSPDGRWVAYASDETGSLAIYVQRFPEGGERQQVSTGATGALVGWAADGRKIYYVFENRMMEVELTTAPRIRAGTPRPLFEADFYRGNWYSRDVHLSADGERFATVAPDEEWGVANEIRVILNWFDELKRQTGT
jgi:Tol biopolymer transport system component